MSKKPRVGIISRPIEQGTSGSGFHLSRLVWHMANLNELFEIYLIRYGNKPLKYSNVSGEVIIPRNPLKASLKLKKYNFDLIHYNPLTIFSPIWIKDTKKVATIHGAAPYFLKNQYKLIHKLHNKLITPKYAQKMNSIFTVSQTSCNFIKKQYGIEKDNIKVIYNAVDESFQRYDSKEISNLLYKNFNISNPYILHVSKFSERKNPWTILKGFKEFITINQLQQFNLILAGNGWENQSVKQFVHKLNIENYVKYLGFVSTENLIILLNGAEVFLFPSLYEGFGMPNLEAMACGCPVITSNVFAIPEIVQDAAIVLNDPNDYEKIAAYLYVLVSDENLRRSLVDKGYDRVKKYSWDKSAITVLNSYKEIVMN